MPGARRGVRRRGRGPRRGLLCGRGPTRRESCVIARVGCRARGPPAPRPSSPPPPPRSRTELARYDGSDSADQRATLALDVGLRRAPAPSAVALAAYCSAAGEFDRIGRMGSPARARDFLALSPSRMAESAHRPGYRGPRGLPARVSTRQRALESLVAAGRVGRPRPAFRPAPRRSETRAARWAT